MVAQLLQILAIYWPSLAMLCLSAIPAAYIACHDHGKWEGIGKTASFFGSMQWIRKYKREMLPDGTYGPLLDAPDTWYYRFFKIKYEERFPLAATFLSAFTDGYHSFQALMRILMSLSVTLAISAPWWAVIAIWWTYDGVHMIFYKVLSR